MEDLDRIRRRAEMIPSDEEDPSDQSQSEDEEDEQGREDALEKMKKRADMIPSDEEEDSDDGEGEEEEQDLGQQAGALEKMKRRANLLPSDEDSEHSSEEAEEDVNKTGDDDEEKDENEAQDESGDDYYSNDGDYDSNDDEGNGGSSKQESSLKSLTMGERLRRIREGALYAGDSSVAKDSIKKGRGGGGGGGGGGKEVKRANKNRPVEMSSKVPVGRYREVVPGAAAKPKFRDPRFEGLSGKLNYDLFRKAYDFLEGYQDHEIAEIQKQLKKQKKKGGKNSTQQKHLQSVLDKMQQQRLERRRGDRVRGALQARKRDERKKVAEGKKPFFLKNSEKKKIEMDERYKELKQRGKLKKYMERKRKRNASKDHKYIPMKRRGGFATGVRGGGDDDS